MSVAVDGRTLVARLDEEGFAVVPGVLDAEALDEVADALARRGAGGARQLLDEAWCVELARRLRSDARLAEAIPPTHVPVQCTAFEKSRDHNWLVPVHQDVAIPVAARVDDAALVGWSNKGGTWFVQPPVDVLAQLVALRVHVDDCGPGDGPLRVVPASHRGGRLDDAAAFALRDARGSVACPVPRGGAMLMRPLLLHASSKATGTSRRRVLHFLFGPPRLPHGLAWASAR
jgi:ectoine hydroxylase-related dioxygenase (phytanoyl-CoA dioxygenase family)